MAKINAKTTGGGGVETIADSTGVLELQSAGTTMATISPSGFNLGSGTPSIATALSPYTGFKNRVINGAMVIDQRNGGASVTPPIGAATYTLDRFATFPSQASKLTVQQNAGSVTPPTGFRNYLGITSTSSYSVLAADQFLISQPIEGLNVSDLAWGTASASTVTLSFWVRSSLTGTFGGAIQNAAQNRSYPYSYTISSANTWEQKSITIAGDTTGTWLTTNGVGLYLFFSLGSGSTFSGTAGSWASSAFSNVTGATSVVGTNGATFYITGVQLEVGTSATSFEYRDIGRELMLCQRYYSQSVGGTTFNLNASNSAIVSRPVYANFVSTGTYSFPVTMRATPTVTIYNTVSGTPGNVRLQGGGFAITASADRIGQNGFSGIFCPDNNFPGTDFAYVPWKAEIEL
jgi:hypothetical protein